MDVHDLVNALMVAWQSLFLLHYRETNEVYYRVPNCRNICKIGAPNGGR